jgi:hypothetical protein
VTGEQHEKYVAEEAYHFKGDMKVVDPWDFLL